MNRILLALVGVVVVVGGVAVGVELFAPERATQVTDTDAMSTDGTSVLKSGTFEGKTGHRVSGTVELVDRDGTLFLRFVDYEQTQGPDVFVYLTPAEDPDTNGEIDEGVRILVDGGADGGESTKEGTFLQELPGDIDPEEYNGVAIWCDRFNTPFGAAALR